MTTKIENTHLVLRAQKALDKQIELIRAAPPSSKISKANQHLLSPESKSGGFGIGAGELSCAGFIYYALNCTLAVAGTYSCVVSFNATGVGWDVGAFTSQVAGTFLVNPKEIAGSCYFICVAVDVGEGGVSFSLFDKEHGTLYGTFVGDTEGGDVADITGIGKLTVS